MTAAEVVVGLIGLAIAIYAGYDAERWDQDVNVWTFVVLLSAAAGAAIELGPGGGEVNAWIVPAVVVGFAGLAGWLVARQREMEARRAAGSDLPPALWRWLRGRRQQRRAGA